MTRRLLTSAMLVLLVGSLLLAGCGKNKEAAEMENFVMNYCSIMQAAYAKADLNMVVPMTTEKELKKLFPVFQALKATGNVMMTEIQEFKVKDVDMDGDKASVKTAEKWRFWWQEQSSGRITKPHVVESYRLRYHLVRSGGSWKVDSVENLNK